MPIYLSAKIAPYGSNKMVDGKSVDLTTGTDGSSYTITNDDLFLIDANAQGTEASTYYVTGAQLKAYIGSVTVDDALSASSANPVENHVVYDALATKLNLVGGDITGALKITKTSTQLTLAYDGSNEARFLTSSTGGLSISTVGTGTTDSDLLLNVDGSITLDSANGSITCLDNGSTYTPSADADVANKAYVDSHQKFSESIEFYFDQEVTSRTYFRDADDSNYPFKWDTYDTEDSITVGDTISITPTNATGGVIVPYDCKLKGVRWVGYNGQNYNQVVDLQVWTGTVGNHSMSMVTATLRDSRRVTNHNRESFNIGQALDVSLSAGDSVLPAFLYTSGTAVMFSGKVVFLFERA